MKINLSRETIRKILESAKLGLGIVLPFSLIWGFDLPFDPAEYSDIIDFLLPILFPVSAALTLAVSGFRALRRSFKKDKVSEVTER